MELPHKLTPSHVLRSIAKLQLYVKYASACKASLNLAHACLAENEKQFRDVSLFQASTVDVVSYRPYARSG